MRTPLERREFQVTLEGQALLYYPAPLTLTKEWEQERKRESINETTGG